MPERLEIRRSPSRQAVHHPGCGLRAGRVTPSALQPKGQGELLRDLLAQTLMHEDAVIGSPVVPWCSPLHDLDGRPIGVERWPIGVGTDLGGQPLDITLEPDDGAGRCIRVTLRSL